MSNGVWARRERIRFWPNACFVGRVRRPDGVKSEGWPHRAARGAVENSLNPDLLGAHIPSRNRATSQEAAAKVILLRAICADNHGTPGPMQIWSSPRGHRPTSGRRPRRARTLDLPEQLDRHFLYTGSRAIVAGDDAVEGGEEVVVHRPFAVGLAVERVQIG